jgi:hypothetical protein
VTLCAYYSPFDFLADYRNAENIDVCEWHSRARWQPVWGQHCIAVFPARVYILSVVTDSLKFSNVVQVQKFFEAVFEYLGIRMQNRGHDLG